MAGLEPSDTRIKSPVLHQLSYMSIWLRIEVLTLFQRCQRPLHYLYANPQCGTGDGIRTRKFDVIAPTDFKSVFCTNSNTPAYGGIDRSRTCGL